MKRFATFLAAASGCSSGLCPSWWLEASVSSPCLWTTCSCISSEIDILASEKGKGIEDSRGSRSPVIMQKRGDQKVRGCGQSGSRKVSCVWRSYFWAALLLQARHAVENYGSVSRLSGKALDSEYFVMAWPTMLEARVSLQALPKGVRLGARGFIFGGITRLVLELHAQRQGWCKILPLGIKAILVILHQSTISNLL